MTESVQLDCRKLKYAMDVMERRGFRAKPEQWNRVWWYWAKAHPVIEGKAWPGVCPRCQDESLSGKPVG